MFRALIVTALLASCAAPAESSPPSPGAAANPVQLPSNHADVVANRQRALHEGDWEAFSRLLHPDVRKLVLRGFDDPESLEAEVAETLAPLRAEMGTEAGSMFGPSAEIKATYDEGPLRHVVVDNGGMLPRVVTLRSTSTEWMLDLPPSMSARFLQQPAPRGNPSPKATKTVVEAFEAMEASESLHDEHEFGRYAESLHPDGVRLVFSELEELRSGPYSAATQEWSAAWLKRTPEEFVATVEASSFGSAPKAEVSRQLFGGFEVEAGAVVIFRTFYRLDGAVFSLIDRRLMRRHEGTWKIDIGATYEAGEGQSASQFRARRAMASVRPPTADSVECSDTSRFDLTIDGQQLLCQRDLKSVLSQEDKLSFLLTSEAKSRLKARTEGAMQLDMTIRIDGGVVSKPTLIGTLDTRVLTIEPPRSWSRSAVDELAASLDSDLRAQVASP